ncbi:MAG TPA: 4-alpha-glucanotransferase [Anaeromyxobacteraceae bacterium]|nr:4-alpha-glucanotransferase [Anaeromyxobacteraceae bacterium]
MISHPRRQVREALALLGIRRLLVGVHDAAFPGTPEEDVGRGTPYGDGAATFLELVAGLGFDGVQLGPQGALSPDDPSPYNGTSFSRNPVSAALAPLARAEWAELLAPQALAEAVSRDPATVARADHARAHRAVHRALDLAFGSFQRRWADASAGSELARLVAELEAFRVAQAEWLGRDARHVADAGTPDRFTFVQFVVHAQHAALRRRAAALGLVVFGDLQIGLSPVDAHAAAAFLLPGYRMGAPPSRTNPAGQPWHYRVLDPLAYREGETARDGQALRFFRARLRKAFAEYDGLRIDHPHGLVDPWVYREDAEPERAVREGARLFSSPDLADHAELSAHAIARPEQLRRAQPRHADGWVAALDAAQVARYGALFDALMEAAAEAGRAGAVACEILSTQPYPLARVLERHGLGRFRVTQKADLGRADDVYRSENARPEDWVMLGNHDTRPILPLAEAWVASGASRAHAEHLAMRLLPPEEPRAPFVERVATDARELVQAAAAELFAGPAQQVMIYFTDLLGERERYNAPGTVSASNWSLRLPRDAAGAYARRLAERRAIDLPRALARALRSRGPAFVARHRGLILDLERGG